MFGSTKPMEAAGIESASEVSGALKRPAPTLAKDWPSDKHVTWASVRECRLEHCKEFASQKFPVCNLTGTYPIWYI
jgi:hypothetical protein